MEAGYSEEKFLDHIKTVVNAAEGDAAFDERPLTLDELKELAVSMGMSEEEWDNLQAQAVINLHAAEDHLKARNFNEAIAQAEHATSINPYITNGNGVLAKAYHMLWLEDHDLKAKEKAAYHARRELLVDPKDKNAINILSAINKDGKLATKETKSKKLIFIIAGAAVLVILIFALLMRSPSSANKDTGNIENQIILAEENMLSKYDLVQTAISQRNNMLPDLFNAVGGGNSEMKKLDQEIDNLKQKIKNAKKEDKFKLENELDKKVSEAKKLAKTYGNASDTELLLIQIEGAENRIAFEKKTYNDAVKEYNILVKQNKNSFPELTTQPYYNAE